MRKLNSQGAAAIEFAIVLPVLVALLFGIIEFSLLFYDKAVITNASREGARFGTLFVETGNPPVVCDDIKGVIDAYVADRLITFGGATAVTTDCGVLPTTPGGDLTVTVSYPYDYLVLPGFVPGLNAGVTLTAQTVMRKE